MEFISNHNKRQNLTCFDTCLCVRIKAHHFDYEHLNVTTLSNIPLQTFRYHLPCSRTTERVWWNHMARSHMTITYVSEYSDYQWTRRRYGIETIEKVCSTILQELKFSKMIQKTVVTWTKQIDNAAPVVALLCLHTLRSSLSDESKSSKLGHYPLKDFKYRRHTWRCRFHSSCLEEGCKGLVGVTLIGRAPPFDTCFTWISDVTGIRPQITTLAMAARRRADELSVTETLLIGKYKQIM